MGLTTQVPKGNIKRGMNKTESEFGLILKAQYPDAVIWFEQIKLRLADGCWYIPDFIRYSALTGEFCIYEVKGRHIWDDSKVKFKCAKEQYPHFEFQMHQKKAGQWTRLM